ncbi:MAG TPA: AraC family transcriptional regulator [Stellaceae bacterium]|nr:AraC family transcriptional regulator [Stellaceae bacterium]
MRMRSLHERAARIALRGEGGPRGRAAMADFRLGEGGDGIERAEAFFPSHGFSLHRHDTYAIGLTVAGVQTFHYRGRQRYCRPGQCHILHPDEAHDGAAAAEGGFRYRIVYIDPALIQRAIGGRPLPFLAEPVLDLAPAQRRLLDAAWEMEESIDALGQAELVAAVAEFLEAHSSPRPRRREPLRLAALERVRAAIAAAPTVPHRASDLEREAGLDRWTLARQFRAAFGTSPTRFRTLRQLDRARALLKRGTPLAEAALEVGFADQCHMTRHFKRAYGLSPGRWVASLSARAD